MPRELKICPMKHNKWPEIIIWNIKLSTYLTIATPFLAWKKYSKWLLDMMIILFVIFYMINLKHCQITVSTVPLNLSNFQFNTCTLKIVIHTIKRI
jgi:hypothetical protein